MNHRVSIAASAMLLAAAAPLLAFGLNYNASKSNTGNIVIHSPTVTEAQANAILASIDKGRQPPTEAAMRSLLTVTGVKQGAIKSIIIESNQGKTTVLLLDDPADASKARSVANITTSRSNTSHN